MTERKDLSRRRHRHQRSHCEAAPYPEKYAASVLAEVGARANVRVGPMETASCVGVGGVVQKCLRYL